MLQNWTNKHEFNTLFFILEKKKSVCHMQPYVELFFHFSLEGYFPLSWFL